jgi:hypothetical protein
MNLLPECYQFVEVLGSRIQNVPHVRTFRIARADCVPAVGECNGAIRPQIDDHFRLG